MISSQMHAKFEDKEKRKLNILVDEKVADSHCKYSLYKFLGSPHFLFLDILWTYHQLHPFLNQSLWPQKSHMLTGLYLGCITLQFTMIREYDATHNC